jgi:hypothetical protein
MTTMENEQSTAGRRMVRINDDAHALLEDLRRITRERNYYDAMSEAIKFVVSNEGRAHFEAWSDQQRSQEGV